MTSMTAIHVLITQPDSSTLLPISTTSLIRMAKPRQATNNNTYSSIIAPLFPLLPLEDPRDKNKTL